MGCLVLATEKVLLPWVKDARVTSQPILQPPQESFVWILGLLTVLDASQALEDIIKAQMGAFASPFLRWASALS